MKKITFTPIFAVEKTFYPEPATKNIPAWYRKMSSYVGSNKLKITDAEPNLTIKKCIPIFDSMTAGYIIKTHVDVFVYLTEDNLSYYNWPKYEPVSFHPISQAPNYPLVNEKPYPKWQHPWGIQTPPGYSTLFVPPMHNPNGIFNILPGIVDTDQYINPVNLPFILDDPNFEGIIPAGTPVAQVIPFKRDCFKMEIGDKKQKEKLFEFNSIYSNRWINNYKSKFWNRKQYK